MTERKTRVVVALRTGLFLSGESLTVPYGTVPTPAFNTDEGIRHIKENRLRLTLNRPNGDYYLFDTLTINPEDLLGIRYTEHA